MLSGVDRITSRFFVCRFGNSVDSFTLSTDWFFQEHFKRISVEILDQCYNSTAISLTGQIKSVDTFMLSQIHIFESSTWLQIIEPFTLITFPPMMNLSNPVNSMIEFSEFAISLFFSKIFIPFFGFQMHFISESCSNWIREMKLPTNRGLSVISLVSLSVKQYRR